MTVNGPACAYCGKRYDFANRPVRIENCCPNCIPPQPKPKPRLVQFLGRPLLLNAPDGHCPHGEAMCDDQCEPYRNCVLERDEP